ncbi:MAG: RHS repeat-associated core domain-containing protein [Anaerolineae bacterium]|nr:RHS repeat-associated core domain-containing protein [Anaerolineae bacterium]
MRYTPFGSPRVQAGEMSSSRRFTSQNWDAGVGLYDYSARLYNPLIGKFVSADTVVPNPARPQSLNRYAYVENSPLNYTDPTGHARSCEETGCTDARPKSQLNKSDKAYYSIVELTRPARVYVTTRVSKVKPDATGYAEHTGGKPDLNPFVGAEMEDSLHVPFTNERQNRHTSQSGYGYKSASVGTRDHDYDPASSDEVYANVGPVTVANDTRKKTWTVEAGYATPNGLGGAEYAIGINFEEASTVRIAVPWGQAQNAEALAIDRAEREFGSGYSVSSMSGPTELTLGYPQPGYKVSNGYQQVDSVINP